LKTILCYGDSNTFGWKPVSFDPKETPVVLSQYRIKYDRRWTGVMANDLGRKYHIIEEGLPGRTTVWDDPVEGEHKNGKNYLLPCLETNAPIDLVILMLGTNDLKARFSLTAYDITMGIAVLIGIIQKSFTGKDGDLSKILIISPPTIGKLTNFKEMFEGSIEKSKKLASYYEKVSKLYGCAFLDASLFIESSQKDGVHIEEKEHIKLGKVIAEQVKNII
jgi:lysophospholipase L1-like esterase